MDEMIQKMGEVFKELDISYVVIGGIAASLLGKPRMTSDTDVIIILQNTNEQLLNPKNLNIYENPEI